MYKNTRVGVYENTRIQESRSVREHESTSGREHESTSGREHESTSGQEHKHETPSGQTTLIVHTELLLKVYKSTSYFFPGSDVSVT